MNTQYEYRSPEPLEFQHSLYRDFLQQKHTLTKTSRKPNLVPKTIVFNANTKTILLWNLLREFTFESRQIVIKCRKNDERVLLKYLVTAEIQERKAASGIEYSILLYGMIG